MANPTITVGFNAPDPNECPANVTEQVALLTALIHAEMVGDYIPYVTGAETPSVDDQDKVWHRQDTSGRPIGTFVFYSGAWRREYRGPGIVMYDGDPAVDFSGPDGLGTVGGDWDGFALCNGNNGTPNLSDKFVVGAKIDDLTVGYASGWKTGVSGSTTQTGGAKDITLDATNTYRPAHDAVQVRRWSADGNAVDAAGGLYGTGTAIDLLPADPGNETPPAIPTLPPYYALAFAKWVGYA